jgi:DNA-binding response OmpR family regulator
LKLLFVDDMRDTRDFFRFAFELENVEVRLASNGQEAVDIVRREDFDAIVMDVEMPEMNGWDAVSAIRQIPNGQGIPILMYTAVGDSETRRKAAEVGANTVLFKPLLPREILARIEKLLAPPVSRV